MEHASDHAASQEVPESTTGLSGPVQPPLVTAVLALQARAGNHAVGHLLRTRAAVQRQPAEAPAVTTRSFSPTKGIVIDQTDKSMHISGKIESYGPESSAANAAAAEATIRKYWNQSFPDGYSVTCDVAVAAGSGSAGDAAKISMEKASQDSHVSRITGVMSLNMNEADALSWTVAHEFGHQLGLKDRYSEAIMSKARGAVGMKRTGSKADPGYEGNLMADVSGATESKNVRDLGTENTPWSWQTDDEVRDWIARQGGKLGGLSTATKIAMIDKLFEGWISDEDVEAIGEIAKSATPGAQSAAIKSHLTSRLLDMTSIGQRTRVRVFIAGMP